MTRNILTVGPERVRATDLTWLFENRSDSQVYGVPSRCCPCGLRAQASQKACGHQSCPHPAFLPFQAEVSSYHRLYTMLNFSSSLWSFFYLTAYWDHRPSTANSSSPARTLSWPSDGPIVLPSWRKAVWVQGEHRRKGPTNPSSNLAFADMCYKARCELL